MRPDLRITHYWLLDTLDLPSGTLIRWRISCSRRDVVCSFRRRHDVSVIADSGGESSANARLLRKDAQGQGGK
jgi:hypothetical protein